MSGQSGESAPLAELACTAKADLRQRQRSPVFRARSALASLVLGKDNWRVIFRQYVAEAAIHPEQVEALLREHIGGGA